MQLFRSALCLYKFSEIPGQETVWTSHYMYTYFKLLKYDKYFSLKGQSWTMDIGSIYQDIKMNDILYILRLQW